MYVVVAVAVPSAAVVRLPYASTVNASGAPPPTVFARGTSVASKAMPMR